MLFHIVRLDRLWLEARVPESDVGRLERPSGAWFSMDGFRAPVQISTAQGARLITDGVIVDPGSRTAPAIFEFDNPSGRLRPGLAVQAHLYTGRADATIAVPLSALVDDNGQPVVYVQTAGETMERRAVQPVQRDGDWVGIASGLAEGERVVSRGAYQVRLAAAAPSLAGEGHAH
jgi:multidrug efflux pump subunit AcrA (membrane-fusion protein)